VTGARIKSGCLKSRILFKLLNTHSRAPLSQRVEIDSIWSSIRLAEGKESILTMVGFGDDDQHNIDTNVALKHAELLGSSIVLKNSNLVLAFITWIHSLEIKTTTRFITAPS
jgi:hypothetical protein